MKQLLITIAALVLVGCGESQQSAPAPEVEPTEPIAEAAKPELPPTKAPDISIHEAASKGNIEAVKQHLAAGTDVDEKGVMLGYTPLQEASMKGHKEVAELLIAKGANVNPKDDDGYTLKNVASEGHTEIVELLIANGAVVNAKDGDGETALDEAVKNEHTETADLIRKYGGKTGDWFKAGESIHIAARVGHIEAVKQHLVSGADVNTTNYRGETPLHHAAIGGHKEIAELLIAKGADVNAKDDFNSTPLQEASIRGHKEVSELLIANGADMNAKDDREYSSLHYAATKGRKEIIELLIAEGADVNIANRIGQTALDMAEQLPEIAALLRKHGGKTAEELKAEGK